MGGGNQGFDLLDLRVHSTPIKHSVLLHFSYVADLIDVRGGGGGGGGEEDEEEEEKEEKELRNVLITVLVPWMAGAGGGRGYPLAPVGSKWRGRGEDGSRRKRLSSRWPDDPRARASVCIFSYILGGGNLMYDAMKKRTRREEELPVPHGP